jgi:hypothetical protein
MSASVVVCGALANKAGNGGEAWVRLSWVLGLDRLGHDVFFVEHIDEAIPAQREYFAATVEVFGLTGRSFLLERGVAPSEELLDLAAAADLLVNISGNLTPSPLFPRFRRKVYVDLDPGYTQIWHHAGLSGARLEGHDLYFTVGEGVGGAGCPIPTNGIDWRPLRPPVLLEAWPVVRTDAGRLTTVATWRAPYGRLEHDGRHYGLKLDEFRKLVALPKRVSQTLELALDIDPVETSDRELLDIHGWQVVEASSVAATPDTFRSYVQGSSAEFSAAQGVYVETASGWFSDRTTRYLASGKPALIQDTGFSRRLPTGEGLIAFRTLDEAVAGAERLAADYDHHCRAARALAEEEFDSDVILSRFLEEACP